MMKHFFLLVLMVVSMSSKSQDKPVDEDAAPFRKSFEKGRSIISLGYGFPNAAKRILKLDFHRQLTQWNSQGVQNTSSITYTVTGIGPISFKVEQAVTNWLGIGPMIIYSRVTSKYQFHPSTPGQNGFYFQTNNYEVNTYELQTFTAGLRFNFHLWKNKSEDLYFGFASGYNLALITVSDEYNNRFLHEPNAMSSWYQLPYLLSDLRSPLYFAFSFGLREYISKSVGIFVEMGYDRWSFIHGGLVFR